MYEIVVAKRARTNNVGTIGGANDDDRLLGAHAVHFGQQLIDDAIAGAAGIAQRCAARLGDRIELVEEENARRRLSRLLKHFAHIRLRLNNCVVLVDVVCAIDTRGLPLRTTLSTIQVL
jgi:hypothetical protein